MTFVLRGFGAPGLGCVLSQVLVLGVGCSDTPTPTRTQNATPSGVVAGLSVAELEQAVRNGCIDGDHTGMVPKAGTDELDLLIVTDRSGSMLDKLDSLGHELPRVVEMLTSGDLDGDGQADFMPVRSVRVALTSNDLGVQGGYGLPGNCALPRDGGNLFEVPGGGSYFEFDADSSASDYEGLGTLLASLGSEGCGIEQPFEATLSTLTGRAPYADVSTDWPTPTRVDFQRERSVLAVLLLTDEDDCSVLPPQNLLSKVTPEGEEPINIRCAFPAHSAELRPVEEFVAQLKGLREGVPARVIFGAIAGFPTGEVTPTAALLDDPRMQIVADSQGFGLTPVCSVPETDAAGVVGESSAVPSRRIAQAAISFGDYAALSSICGSDLAAPIARTFLTVAQSFAPLPSCE